MLLAKEDGSLNILLIDNHVLLSVIYPGVGYKKELKDTKAIEQGKWIHFAAVIKTFQKDENQKSSLRLFRNGVPVSAKETKGDLCDFNPNTHNSFGFGWHNDDDPRPLKMADVQIWNKARSEEEIKDSMYLTLTGRESALSGYWRMGGILPGTPRTVVDFSVHHRNAVVHGDAFVAAKTLKRHLGAMAKDGNNILATSYKNNDLFAVSQRAEYVESFEFRLDNGTKAPTDNLFQFNHWGKTSRGADGQIPENEKDAEKDFLMKQSSFKPMRRGGWYKASCTFVVPDGVSLMRSFGISNVRGDWQNLHIRKHQILCLSDHITEECFSDRIGLQLLAENKQAIDAINELDTLEKKEGILLRELRKIGVLLYDKKKWEIVIDTKKSDIKKEKDRLAKAKDGFDFYMKETEYSKLLVKIHFHHSYNHGFWTDHRNKDFPYGIGIHTPPDRSYWYPREKYVPKGLRQTYSDGCSYFAVMTDQIKTRSQKTNDDLKSGNTDTEHIKSKLTGYKKNVNSSNRQISKYEKELDNLLKERSIGTN